MLNMQPRPPAFAGQLDFDLTSRVEGKACVSTESAGLGMQTYVQWLAVFPLSSDFDGLPSHGPTREAVALAVADAFEKAGDVDTIVLTRITTTAPGDKHCARVIARGVQLKKAMPAKAHTPLPEPSAEKLDDSDTEE